jgi:hypothetical protein
LSGGTKWACASATVGSVEPHGARPRGTVEWLRECARKAGLPRCFLIWFAPHDEHVGKSRFRAQVEPRVATIRLLQEFEIRRGDLSMICSHCELNAGPWELSRLSGGHPALLMAEPWRARYSFFVPRLSSERRQVSAQSDLLICVLGAHNFSHSAMLSDAVLGVVVESLIPPVPGLGTRPLLLPKDEGSCVPFCWDGEVVLALGS